MWPIVRRPAVRNAPHPAACGAPLPLFPPPLYRRQIKLVRYGTAA
jgi:hypothetical protein